MYRMKDTEIIAGVKALIEQAARKQGWSIAELTRRVGKGPSTLHRWRNGTTTCYDLPALIRICNYADASLDDVFGISTSATADRANATQAHDEESVERQAHLTSLRGLTKAMSSILTTMEQTVENALSSEPGATGSSGRIQKAIDKLGKLNRKRQANEELDISEERERA